MRTSPRPLPPLLKSIGHAIILAALLTLLAFVFMFWHKHPPYRRAHCLNNVRQIIVAIKTYAADNGGCFASSASRDLPIDPTTHYADLGLLYPRYLSSLDVFTCPSSGDKMPKTRKTDAYDNKPFRKSDAGQVSYAYSYDGSGGKPRPWTEAAPSTTRILADRPVTKKLTSRSNHKGEGRNIAFQDGHVRWSGWRFKLLTDPDNPDPAINNKSWWSEK